VDAETGEKKAKVNVVFQLLDKLMKEDVPFYYKGNYFNLSSPDAPPNAVFGFVNGQFKALKEKLKDAE
jgi:hypothetical protein